MSNYEAGIVFVFLGLIFLLGTIIKCLKEKKKISGCTKTVIAVVVNVDSKIEYVPYDRIVHAPVLKYCVDDIEYTNRHDIYREQQICKQGQSVEIKCNPSNPNLFYIPKGKTSNASFILTVIMDMILIIAGVWLYF